MYVCIYVCTYDHNHGHGHGVMDTGVLAFIMQRSHCSDTMLIGLSLIVEFDRGTNVLSKKMFYDTESDYAVLFIYGSA